MAELTLQNPAYQQLFNEIEAVRIAIFKSDAIRSFAFILIAAAVVFVYGMKKIPKAALLGVMGLLILLDMMPVDKRYLNDDSFQRKNAAKQPYVASQADLQIMQDKEPDFRVFNTTRSPFNDAGTSYFHKSIGGYHGAKLRRYQDLIDHHLSKYNMQVIDMLNTKYFIVRGKQGPMAQLNPDRMGPAWFVHYIKWVPNPDQEIIHLGNVMAVKLLSTSPQLEVFGRPMEQEDTIIQTTDIILRSPDGKTYTFDLGKFNLQQGVSYVFGNDPANTDSNFVDLSGVEGGKLLAKKQFEATMIFRFRPGQAAVIDKRFKSYLGDYNFTFDPSATIKLLHYQPNYLKYETNAATDQLAVFSEIYYDKGWNAFLDGKKVDYARADYILRSMKVPAGKHIIEFRFEPKSYYIGKTVSLIGSILVLLLFAGAVYWSLSKTKESDKLLVED